ncbi:anthrone oxygenase family protein [Streptomyces tubercidicus]
MRALQTVTLLVATLGTGLMAGLFAAFAYAVMPGLARSGDRSFVRAMQYINRAILNGWFLLPFLLPIPLLILATVLSWNGHGRVALPWILAALVLYLAGFFVTSGVNVPLNNALDKADAEDDGRVRAARAVFEGRWVTWNIVRAVLHTAAFGVLAWALFLHGTAGQA